jgi:outer membrane protein TolC
MSSRYPYQMLALAGLALSLLAAPGFGAETGLTLAQAQQQALARSRQLPAADAAISAAREMAVAAGQLPDPVLRAGIDNLPVSGADRFSIASDSMTMRRIGIMQEFTRGEKRALRAARYGRSADKAVAEKAVAAARIERDTALAWFDLYYAAARTSLVAEQLSQAELEASAAESAYRGGRASQADVFTARGAIAMLRDRASEAAKTQASARTMLARWVGTEVAPSGQPDIDHVRLDPATLETELTHHPEIAALQTQEEVARLDARLAAAERSADWSVELALQQRGPGYANMVSVGVSVPLQWDRKNRQDRDVAARTALAAQAGDEREEALRMHIAETRAMLGEWQSGRERLQRFHREIIPLAQARSAAALAAYRGMKSPLAEVLAARTGEVETRLQALALEQDTAKLWARLNFLYPSGGKEMP